MKKERTGFMERFRTFLRGGLTMGERTRIIGKLDGKQELVKRAISLSPTLSPDLNRPYPEGTRVRDILVLKGRLPLEMATDTTLREIFRLTKSLEQAGSPPMRK